MATACPRSSSTRVRRKPLAHALVDDGRAQRCLIAANDDQRVNQRWQLLKCAGVRDTEAGVRLHPAACRRCDVQALGAGRQLVGLAEHAGWAGDVDHLGTVERDEGDVFPLRSCSGPGLRTCRPSRRVVAAHDLSGFDRAHPAGADYVIVPAMRDDNDPVINAWLRQQAEKGARIIGVCVGALVVGQAGLLDGRRFASHWYYRNTLLDRHPGATYVPHQRYVIDRGVATTTGITASLPATLTLVAAIGGRDKAQALAAELGVSSWTPAHDSTPFGLNTSRAWAYLLNKAAFWRHERWSVEVRDGLDDIALALAADAWSRTGRVSVDAASDSGPVTLRSGLVLMAQPAAEGSPRLPLAPALKPAQQLERTLCEIAERYGAARREWVMMEMEYPGAATDCTQ